MIRAAPSSPTRSAATPTATALTSCSTRLPGAAQRAGLELLAFGGRFVEIGKRDIYGDTRMGLFPFRRNLAFYAVDLALLTLTNPGTLRRLLETVYRQIADGVLPIPETHPLPIA